MNIIKGVVPEPQKVVIYGPQGIGKSSLAALFPSPLFLDTERGSRRLPIDRLEISTLAEFTAAVQACAKQGDFRDYQTIVVDTIDWLEAKVKEKIVAQYSAKDRAYDREGSYIGDEMMKVLSSLDTLTQAGKHVVLLAHSATVKIDLPDQQASFDRYELDMNKKHVAPIVKHWADHLLFLRYKLRVREVDEGKNKGLGGEDRLICLSTCASYDAKVRGKEPLSGEHSCKSPEEGIAVVKKIFTNASAPWAKEAAPAPAPAEEVKPSEEKTVMERARERGNKTNWPKTDTATETASAPAEWKPEPSRPEDDEIPGLPPIPAGESQQSAKHPLEDICGPQEAVINAFLVGRREIAEGQTFRDVRDNYVSRVMKNPVLFMEQATKGAGVAS
jgi:hypothetical protein